MRDHLIVLAVVSTVTLVAMPAVRLLARRLGAVVAPDERRVHERPTPTLGGLAMLAGVAAGVAVASRLDTYQDVFRSSSEPLGVLAAALVIVVIGALDDVRPVSAPAKVAGQVLAGSLLSLAGVSMFFFRVPFGDFVVLSADLAPLVTVVWVVLMANAVNLIDGLDGLAAGVVAIAAGAFFVYADLLGDEGQLGTGNIGPLVVLLALGACVGFLPWNFHPARIFMGDSGSMLLGLLMAAATIVIGGRANDQFVGQNYFFFAPVVIPFLILGVAVFDTLLAVLRRASRAQGIATPDRDHLHHRLLRLGHNHRRSVAILWAWTLLLSALALYPASAAAGSILLPLGLLAVALAGFTVLPLVSRLRDRLLGVTPGGPPDTELAARGPSR